MTTIGPGPPSEAPDPTLAAGEVVVETRAAGLCPSDVSLTDNTLTLLLAAVEPWRPIAGRSTQWAAKVSVGRSSPAPAGCTEGPRPGPVPRRRRCGVAAGRRRGVRCRALRDADVRRYRSPEILVRSVLRTRVSEVRTETPDNSRLVVGIVRAHGRSVVRFDRGGPWPLQCAR